MVVRARAVEGVVTGGLDILPGAYRGRRVLLTGHTGFKGSWLATWLASLGAYVTGFALAAEDPSLFRAARVGEVCEGVIGDVRDAEAVSAVVDRAAPDIVFHLAAQAIVRAGYADPVGTFATNVSGTVHLLEALRVRQRPAAVVIVTSDKCYRPSERPHREDDPLGGEDPYSASKAACEIVVEAYRASFFPSAALDRHGVAVATARAGNVIGGGDWAADRIVPDVVRALIARSPVGVRNPDHVRPWQHVLEPLSGYLTLGAGLLGALPGVAAAEVCEAWNFAPRDDADRTVREIVEGLLARWGSGSWTRDAASGVAEVPYLRLDASKAAKRLGWSARWDTPETIARTVDWYKAYAEGRRGEELRGQMREQIDAYAARSARRSESASASGRPAGPNRAS